MKKTVAFCTLGCKVNQYETESIKKQFLEMGYVDGNFEEVADVYVINTQTLGNGKYSGTIYGFEPPHLTNLKELSLNDFVEFDEGQIFSCSSH